MDPQALLVVERGALDRPAPQDPEVSPALQDLRVSMDTKVHPDLEVLKVYPEDLEFQEPPDRREQLARKA